MGYDGRFPLSATQKVAEKKTPIVVEPANPLTRAPSPQGVHFRLVPDPARDGGWYIHSAWPY